MAFDTHTGLLDAVVAQHRRRRRRVDTISAKFRFGIEEEFFLADMRTKCMPRHVPEALFECARAKAGAGIAREFLQPQLEVQTAPHESMSDARAELFRLRAAIGRAAREHGLVVLAAGTHPAAAWREASQTPKERYASVMADLQMIGRRNMLCGMHVHVELPDPSRRVDVMRRMLPYVPLLLALSTSSPFWQSQATGLKGYRLAAYDELPRTGLPELFTTNEEYDAYVEALVRSGVMPDSSYLWWAIRPSQKLPTLELRAPDSCTRLDDSIAIAALYRVLVRHLYYDPHHNGDLDAVARALAVENKWRAQRYGVQGTFATPAGAITVADLLEQIIEATEADAEALGCTQEIALCRAIIRRGTSADAQLRIYETVAPQKGPAAALRSVSEWIAATTSSG
jgi:carboxylate-amine ligase